jgi:hypothetical protein
MRVDLWNIEDVRPYPNNPRVTIMRLKWWQRRRFAAPRQPDERLSS